MPRPPRSRLLRAGEPSERRGKLFHRRRLYRRGSSAPIQLAAKLQKSRRRWNRIEPFPPLDEIDQKFVRVEMKSILRMRQPPCLARAHGFSVGQQDARFFGIPKIRRNHFRENLPAQRSVAHVKHHLHALVKIAVHPIRAAEIGFHIGASPENKNPAVLQKPPNDAAHANPAADSAHPAPRTISSICTPACEAR